MVYTVVDARQEVFISRRFRSFKHISDTKGIKAKLRRQSYYMDIAIRFIHINKTYISVVFSALCTLIVCLYISAKHTSEFCVFCVTQRLS